MAPDIQYFDRDGTWEKPPGAVRTDVILRSGRGGAIDFEPIDTDAGIRVRDGETWMQRFATVRLPSAADVKVSCGDDDGYALIVTHR